MAPGAGRRVIVWSEPAGDHPALATAEFAAVARALGGRPMPELELPRGRVLQAELPNDGRAAVQLADRLGLSRRVFRPSEELDLEGATRCAAEEGAAHASASFRPLGSAGGAASPEVRQLGRAYKSAGGRIDLSHPERSYWVVERAPGRFLIALEIPPAHPSDLADRRMTQLPFRRPVSLPPKLGRAAVNLAGVPPGGRIADPFVGTGALMLEAAVLGLHVSGVDHDAAMVRGAIQNLEAHGQEFQRLRVGDAAEAFAPDDGGAWDAIVTDPPYGRASGSGGESPEELVARVLPAWARLVRPNGRVVVIVPGGGDPLHPPWQCVLSIPDRVHRSLTREFRVYERSV